MLSRLKTHDTEEGAQVKIVVASSRCNSWLELGVIIGR